MELGRVLEARRALHQSQAQEAGIEVDIALCVRRHQGDVVDAGRHRAVTLWESESYGSLPPHGDRDSANDSTQERADRHIEEDDRHGIGAFHLRYAENIP